MGSLALAHSEETSTHHGVSVAVCAATEPVVQGTSVGPLAPAYSEEPLSHNVRGSIPH